MPKSLSKKPTAGLYSGLAILFIVAMTVQAPFTVDVIRSLTSGYQKLPFWVGEPWPTLTIVDQPAAGAGLRVGDRLVAMDGRPLPNPRNFYQAVRAKNVGETVVVFAMRDGRAFDSRVKVYGLRQGPLFAYVALLFLPWLSLALGFWVAASRPHDGRAWMVLGILLGMSQFVRPGVYSPAAWPAAVAVTTYVYREMALRVWAICMMLFGIYFPSRWVIDRKLLWVKWLLLLPIGLFGLWDGFRAALASQNYAAAAGTIPDPLPESATMTLMFVAISIFFIGISFKFRDPKLAADDRRRLKLLYWGCSAAMTPYFLVLLAQLFGKQIGDGPVLAYALMAVVLLPITLAYVIVVQRAMDVRMVIRQGVQYALARRGVRILQIGFMAVAIWVSASFLNSTTLTRPYKLMLVVLLIFLVIRIRDIGEHLRRWVDRRFFREAFNAEQILGDLSGQVRGILDRDALFQTVARKISESLHVERIAVMLRQDGLFRPALAMGYPAGLDLAVGSEYAPLAELERTREPVTVEDGESGGNLGAELLLPLASRKELLGFIGLGPKRSEEPYSASDASLLKTVATQTGMALENTLLSEAIASETAQREMLHREIEIAREVQQRLFPQNQPDIPTLEYAGYCRPARGVGGDYYDFLALASGRLGLAIADVSGKGIPAALLMASLQASTRGQSQSDSSKVADLTANVNRLVCEASPENRYATFFYARFDPATGKLIYTNGGHNPPILLRGGETIRLEKGGPPVGLFKASQYEQEEIQLESGDLLTLFTDGVSEAENAAEEDWGEDRLIETARACRDLPPSEIITRIMQAADVFAAGAPQHDDMTLVVARVL